MGCINFEKKLAYLALTKNDADREVPLTPEALESCIISLGLDMNSPCLWRECIQISLD